MIGQALNRLLGRTGYEVHRLAPRKAPAPVKIQDAGAPGPPHINPIWPLPRKPGGPSDEDIRKEFAKYELWHYAYEFDGGLAFPARHNDPSSLSDAPRRPVQRFRHFMPYLLQTQNGSLRGKRVLDIACNSGFWSIQCALLGAEVLGFDGRPELIEQANLIRGIVGLNNVHFKVLDYWDMSPHTLGGKFDIVLNLGVLYHLPKPLEALECTIRMANEYVVLDTEVWPATEPLIWMHWEEPNDIRRATQSGMTAYPSKSGLDIMLKHIGAAEWREIPIRTADMPADYLAHRRASWLIKV
jgi:tRNA (mo5U34)-methyltransferase